MRRMSACAVGLLICILSVFQGNVFAEISFKGVKAFKTGGYPSSVAIGDFNGDGKADMTVANFSSNNISVLLGNGDGTFKTQKRYAVGVHPTSVAIGDFNGDSKADLAVTNERYGTVSILFGNGDGTFKAQKT